MSWQIHSSSKSQAVRFTAAAIQRPTHPPKVKQRQCHATVGAVFPAKSCGFQAGPREAQSEYTRASRQIWEGTSLTRTILNEQAGTPSKETTRAGGNPRRKTDRCWLSRVFFHGATPRTHCSRPHSAVQDIDRYTR